MVSVDELSELLAQWIKEYGQGGMPKESATNWLQTVIDHKGFKPSSGGRRAIQLNTVADGVESVVTNLQNTPGFFKAAMVLRAYYLGPSGLAEDDRIARLKRIGLPMSRAKYYELVRLGRASLMLILEPARRVA
jgi:hypothetical protein